MGYWEDRLAKSQNKLTSKNIKATEEQLKKYYKKAMEDVVGQFEKTYQHLLSSMDEGREPTPADLYNLDKYWQMQAQLKTKLQKLGDSSYKLMSGQFENQYKTIYNSLSLPSGRAFNTITDENIKQMILQIWCADGKSWSDRIWTNTDKLQQALNDNLINCVLTGKKPTELKQMLMRDFNVSFNNADTIVRTEMAHLQTQAAMQRYKDYGITEVEILADKDERQCEVCGKLHKKRYPTGANVPIPAHPRCRCSVIPVVEMARTPLKINLQLFAKSSENYEKHNKPLTHQTNNVKVVTDEWKNGKFRDEKSEERHKKHLSEYGNITFDEYVEGAKILLSQPIGGDIDGFVNNADATYRYDTVNNDLAIGKDGIIFTRFKPIDGKAYWEDVKNNELKQK